jgi:hypothetical protein
LSLTNRLNHCCAVLSFTAPSPSHHFFFCCCRGFSFVTNNVWVVPVLCTFPSPLSSLTPVYTQISYELCLNDDDNTTLHTLTLDRSDSLNFQRYHSKRWCIWKPTLLMGHPQYVRMFMWFTNINLFGKQKVSVWTCSEQCCYTNYKVNFTVITILIYQLKKINSRNSAFKNCSEQYHVQEGIPSQICSWN